MFALISFRFLSGGGHFLSHESSFFLSQNVGLPFLFQSLVSFGLEQRFDLENLGRLLFGCERLDLFCGFREIRVARSVGV